MRWDTLLLFFYVIFMSTVEHAAYKRLEDRVVALEKKPPSSISTPAVIKKPHALRQ